MIMERIEKFIHLLDSMLDTKRKRHIIGGLLLSASIFLSGLAVTAISLQKGEVI